MYQVLDCHTCTMYMHVFKWEMRRKKEASKVKQTNKAKQHSTPKAVTFPKKNELPCTCKSVWVCMCECVCTCTLTWPLRWSLVGRRWTSSSTSFLSCWPQLSAVNWGSPTMYTEEEFIYSRLPTACTCFNERWEGRKKEASKVKQTNKQTKESITAHPRQSLVHAHNHMTIPKVHASSDEPSLSSCRKMGMAVSKKFG